MKYNDNFAKRFLNALKGDKKEETKVNVPPVKDMLEKLVKIDDITWGHYGFRREPLKGKFETEERTELIKKAIECGKDEAVKIKEKYEFKDMYELAEKLNLKVDYPDRPNGGGHIIFAQFVEPNNITVFKDSVDKAQEIIKNKNLSMIFEDVNVEELLLSHEIFHYIEENNEGLFTRSKKIRLWKLGPLKNDSSIVCLGEIAAMAFAKELLNISYSPYILDVFLVYPYSKEASFALYNEIKNIK